MKKQILLLVLAITGSLFVTTAWAQVKIGNNPTTINGGSILEMETTNKGMLMPRVSLTSTTVWGLAGTAVAGMTVFNTNAGIASSNTAYPKNGAGEYFWDGTGWVSKKANSVNNGLLPYLSLSDTPIGGAIEFAIPVDVLLPSTQLKITYTFRTDNLAGASAFFVCVPGTTACTQIGDTGPCGGFAPGQWYHRTITITRPVAPNGVVIFQMLPTSIPGCQGQNLTHVNIVVQPVN